MTKTTIEPELVELATQHRRAIENGCAQIIAGDPFGRDRKAA